MYSHFWKKKRSLRSFYIQLNLGLIRIGNFNFYILIYDQTNLVACVEVVNSNFKTKLTMSYFSSSSFRRNLSNSLDSMYPFPKGQASNAYIKVIALWLPDLI